MRPAGHLSREILTLNYRFRHPLPITSHTLERALTFCRRVRLIQIPHDIMEDVACILLIFFRPGKYRYHHSIWVSQGFVHFSRTDVSSATEQHTLIVREQTFQKRGESGDPSVLISGSYFFLRSTAAAPRPTSNPATPNGDAVSSGPGAG